MLSRHTRLHTVNQLEVEGMERDIFRVHGGGEKHGRPNSSFRSLSLFYFFAKILCHAEKEDKNERRFRKEGTGKSNKKQEERKRKEIVELEEREREKSSVLTFRFTPAATKATPFLLSSKYIYSARTEYFGLICRPTTVQPGSLSSCSHSILFFIFHSHFALFNLHSHTHSCII